MPRLVIAWFALALAGCAHLRSRTTAAAKPAAEAKLPAPEATGIWDWIFRGSDEHGNLRVEQEEWHLVQRGGAVEGYYDRAVTLLSTDDRLFRCNQKLGFTRFTRVKVAGAVAGDNRIRLQELNRFLRRGCGGDLKALLDEEDLQVLPHRQFVINHQDPQCVPRFERAARW